MRPFAPSEDFSPLRDCIIELWSLDRDETIMAGGALADRVYVLEHGFALDFATLALGKRHIFDFYGPGAVCNWSRPAREDKPENLLLKARSEVSVLDRGRLTELLAEHKNIAIALREHEIRRAMRISQRVRALISLPAKECLRILLLDLEDEFGAAGEVRHWLPMPLTQEEIGDLIGSTSVHVSRTMASLEKDGEIERRGTCFAFCHADALRQRLSYRRFPDPHPLPRTLVDETF